MASDRNEVSEQVRLRETRQRERPWKKWGPYLSERQWGTVREDYSTDGNAWDYFSHDQSRSRAYRWGEDGLGGISDDKQRLCFALSLWNGRDAILKERLFGLTNSEGNHGEDVKEYYFYVDSTPTHSYMKFLYKYPQREFPYRDLIVLTAFSVVLGTLSIQGLTLKPLLRALDLGDDDPVGHELNAARARALHAGLESFAGDESPVAEVVRDTFTAYLGDGRGDTETVDAARSAHGEIQKRALTAARDAVFAMRASEEIGDDAFHRIEEELDWLEMAGGPARPARAPG